MQYFHVRIRLRGGTEITRLDLTESLLRQRYVQPYRSGGRFAAQGRTVSVADVEVIQVSRSDVPSRELRPAVGLPAGVSGHDGDWAVAAFADDVTDDYITEPAGHSGGAVEKAPPDPRTVFVVHGRNDRARVAVFDFLRALDLYPMEWNVAREATGLPAPYVGEVLERAFSDAQAVLVLFTPDEEVTLLPEFRRDGDPADGVPDRQARPNVLFEAGMALGRDAGRTVLVELGRHRPFSDIEGRLKIRLDDSVTRRQTLAQALRAAGCAVNMNGTDWHRAGDFGAAL